MVDICTIRDRRDDDLPTLAAILERVYDHDGYPVEGVSDPMGWLNHPREIRSWTALARSNPIGQVTLTNADPADDAAAIWSAYNDDSIKNLAVIVRLFVDPDYRGTGAGKSLTETALGYAREIGRSITLDVMTKDIAAIGLYERLGGRRIGEVIHQHGDGLAEPAVVYDFPI